jgi:beta-1,4-mannosyltransferase
MQYHAVSLARAGGEVDLIGLAGAPLLPEVAAEPRLTEHRLPDSGYASRSKGGVRRFVWLSAFRAMGQARRLFRCLMRLPKPDTILVQNPPAVPTLAIAWLVAKTRGARLIIDWHNLAHTIAAIRLGESHRAVRALARSEKRWGRRAQAHLAVSQALADWLQREYGLKASVLYDRPSRAFDRPSAEAASALRAALTAQGVLPADRVPLVVCPTSWTPDEDFDLLLESLERAERSLGGGSVRLAAVLTGRGPMRDTFEARVARRRFSTITVKTAWLEPRDYPVLIGMADLGVCLHQSSSGLDLPMKIADFRGAGVPVAAFDYAPVLNEALNNGREGVVFRDPGQLANLLVALASGQTLADSPLARSRAWLAANPSPRWEDCWKLPS